MDHYFIVYERPQRATDDKIREHYDALRGRGWALTQAGEPLTAEDFRLAYLENQTIEMRLGSTFVPQARIVIDGVQG